MESPEGDCASGGRSRLRQLTGIPSIVQGRRQDLERTSKVEEVELGMQGKQNVNWLVCHCGRLSSHLWRRCTGGGGGGPRSDAGAREVVWI